LTHGVVCFHYGNIIAIGLDISIKTKNRKQCIESTMNAENPASEWTIEISSLKAVWNKPGKLF